LIALKVESIFSEMTCQMGRNTTNLILMISVLLVFARLCCSNFKLLTYKAYALKQTQSWCSL